MTSSKYIVSTNEEVWNDDTEFDTREEALSYGLEEYGEESNLFTGIKGEYIVSLGDAKDFLSDFMEKTCDDDGRGEWSENWEISWNKNARMLELINTKLREIENIIMEHHKPDFYIVTDIQR